MHANYGGRYKRECKYKDTTIINGYERYIFEYPDKESDIPETVTE